MTLNTIIVGASGYTGAELVALVHRHPQLHLAGLYVSAGSEDANRPVSALHGQLRGVVDMPLMPLSSPQDVAKQADVVFLATAHAVSHELAPVFLAQGCVVFDLSGAYRVNQADFYPEHYGFAHQSPTWLAQAVYGLAEWQGEALQAAQLVAVPGCYPTASQLALKPVLDAGLLDKQMWPVINATSGVTGAGRKASLTNSFCEVSLHAYGVFSHRHQPEIAAHLDTPVIFTPHLGSYKRGILATITAKLAPGVSEAEVGQALSHAYQKAPLVRVLPAGEVAKLHAVQHTGFCDIGYQAAHGHLILTSAIDNLLKGAASQAVQCLNLKFGFAETTAIV
ncbi:N-acetyl-gamma-glutamyl-phosphate reductase [Salinivibrio sp. MA351]|uniref:N-acetyl-gamma-glutamyl-phosphate reductase n=1 Tax=Salinivibrio costicola subsp. alcaliphilus TaxID=272773 RepID=A0ABX3KV63_SALCS|nr:MULTISPECIES: N-acetyl-gamma-glutamyl-phosphate reductase [Salinivibrio]OOF00848.1 N-acetyl-gamma-glutamyl-phosphate reductase [Salinivibrio sp. MA351]OOF35342.1 N-acetyl-gamma-glutamyl-phosphate reductase [Salinivibrio costicola subsp. alcaliphilus]